MQKVTFRKYALWVSLVLLAIVGLYWAYHAFVATTPDSFSIATGRVGGAYQIYAAEYADVLQGMDVDLEIVETAGSLATLELLLNNEVPVGFVQSGTAQGMETGELYSLGSVFYEPIWIFYRQESLDEKLDYLYELEGKRIGLGEVGSGTNALAREMLRLNEVTEANATFVEQSTIDTAQLLQAGTLDAAFFVLAPVSNLLFDLFLDDELALMDFRRADAYEARFSFLSEFTIGEGTVDLRRNIPAAETTILATTATLVANSTLHPDSARQLLTAAIAVHSDGGYFEDEGEFPSALNTELPVPETVTSFLERGPIGLERYLPISVAALVERILFVILPLLLFLYPLLRSTPSAYSFAIRYRIFRWYQRVRRAEADMGNYSLAELESEIRYLEGLEEQITERVKVPLFYQSDFYQLRMHLRLVIERLIARRAVRLGEPEPNAAITDEPPEMPGTDADKIDFDHTHATE